jgi:hypothetical protein
MNRAQSGSGRRMSSGSGGRKRSELIEKIEIEIARDLTSSKEVELYHSGVSALAILYQVVEQAEEFELTMTEPEPEMMSTAQRQRQIARLNRQSSALKKLLSNPN